MALNLTGIIEILGQIPDLLEPIPDILVGIAEIAIFAAAIALCVGIVYAVKVMVENAMKMKK